MTKKRKNQILVEPATLRLFDKIAKEAAGFSFQQVVMPPVIERQFIHGHSALEERFGVPEFGLNNEMAEDVVFPTTHVHNLAKLYFNSLEDGGVYSDKWFYTAPVLKINKDKISVEHEFGLFVVGDGSALATAQIVSFLHYVLQQFGQENSCTIEINCLGSEHSQKEYKKVLEGYFDSDQNILCENCLNSFESDVLALMACSNVKCKEVIQTFPQIIDSLDDSSRKLLIGTLEIIDDLDVPYVLNPNLYSKIFRHQMLFRAVYVDKDQNNIPLGEGGDFSFLSEGYSETPVAFTGFITTLEQLLQLAPVDQYLSSDRAEVFMISLGDQATRRTLRLYKNLYQEGVRVREAMVGNSGIKPQLKKAKDLQSEIALIVGQKEALDDTVILRDMRSGMQEVFTSERIIDEVKKRLGR